MKFMLKVSAVAAIAQIAIVQCAAASAGKWSGAGACNDDGSRYNVSLTIGESGEVSARIGNASMTGQVSGNAISLSGRGTKAVGTIAGNRASGYFPETIGHGSSCTWEATLVAPAKKAIQPKQVQEPGLIDNTGQMRAILKANVYGVTMAEVRSIIRQNLTKVVDRELTYYDRWVTAHRRLKISQAKITDLDRTLKQQMEAGKQREALRTFEGLKKEVARYHVLYEKREAIAR